MNSEYSLLDGPSADLAYLVDSGAHPWGMRRFTWDDDSCTTLTVIDRSRADMIRFLRVLFNRLSSSHPTMIRWSSAINPSPTFIMQRRRYLAALATPPQGFADHFLDMIDSTVIPCTASRLILPFSREHFDALSLYRYTALVVGYDPSTTPRDVCDALRQYARGLDERAFQSLRPLLAQWTICRAYDDGCTHWAWQWIGARHDVEAIAHLIRDERAVRLGGRDQVAAFLTGRISEEGKIG